MKYFLSIFILLFLLTSCSSSEPVIEEEVIDHDALNETEIQDYISKNNLSPKKSSSGLQYLITKEGTGNTPTLSSRVKVYFKSYDTDGIIFDESPANGVDFNLKNLIKGFSEGVTYLKEGAKATLIIPSKIGYLPNTLPPHFLGGKVIIFDVKLISVN